MNKGTGYLVYTNKQRCYEAVHGGYWLTTKIQAPVPFAPKKSLRSSQNRAW